MLDLTAPGSLKLLSEQIKTDIDAYCVKRYSEGHRGHLGASQIGKSCSRMLWYNFRWVFYKEFDGRQYRLFQRGHFEEPRFTSYLEGIGCEVKALETVLMYRAESDTLFYGSNEQEGCQVVEGLPTYEAKAHELGIYIDKGKRQIRIYGCDGHFAGSLDAMLKLPARYNIEQDVLFLGEYKTQSTTKFPKLVSDGCQLNKYEHFCQQSVYGYKLGLQYGVYVVVNKNDDDLHIEVIKLDWFLGKELEDKAQRIISSEVPPNKISASPSFFECAWCDYKEGCWMGKEADKNCRSCKRCEPVKDANWYCNFHDSVVPKDFVKIGCDDWISII